MKLDELWKALDAIGEASEMVGDLTEKVTDNLEHAEGLLGGGIVLGRKLSSSAEIGGRLVDLAKEGKPISNVRLFFEIGEHFFRHR